ncbi:MAG: hypothetical protein AAFZ15_04520 [Bacteroidota bacterium]
MYEEIVGGIISTVLGGLILIYIQDWKEQKNPLFQFVIDAIKILICWTLSSLMGAVFGYFFTVEFIGLFVNNELISGLTLIISFGAFTGFALHTNLNLFNFFDDYNDLNKLFDTVSIWTMSCFISAMIALFIFGNNENGMGIENDQTINKWILLSTIWILNGVIGGTWIMIRRS